jgi:winged helix DNA-binding protein
VKTLRGRELNRALLARQLLLERSPRSVTKALETTGGLQTQNATSGYIGLWTRLRTFEHADLRRALEKRRAVQGTLMRNTIHLVSAADYPLLAAGTRASRRASFLRGHKRTLGEEELDEAIAAARGALAGTSLSRAELKPVVASSPLWNGVNACEDVVRVPPSGTWERRRADVYALAEDWLGPNDATEEDGVAHLLRRYLGGFGPAPIADAANWAGVPPRKLEPAAEALPLRRFEDEQGRELVDLPRAPLPAADTRAPVRFLPIWDASLLAHARRAEALPEDYRPLVFNAKTPQSVATFLVDGAVAGMWTVERSARKAELVLEPFDGLPGKAADEVKAEGERLVRFHEPDAESHTVRLAGSG